MHLSHENRSGKFACLNGVSIFFTKLIALYLSSVVIYKEKRKSMLTELSKLSPKITAHIAIKVQVTITEEKIEFVGTGESYIAALTELGKDLKA